MKARGFVDKGRQRSLELGVYKGEDRSDSRLLERRGKKFLVFVNVPFLGEGIRNEGGWSRPDVWKYG